MSDGRTKRTNISTDSLAAVKEPPTKIEGQNVTLDPQKVISAWLASAEVLRTVAEATRELQSDLGAALVEIVRTRKAQFRFGLFMLIFHIAAVSTVLYVGRYTVDEIRAESRVMAQEVEKAAQESARMRQEAEVLNTAMAAALAAVTASETADSPAEKERVLLEAEVTVAAAQAKLAKDKKVKARSQEKAKATLKRAQSRSPEIGPISVDSELIEDL